MCRADCRDCHELLRARDSPLELTRSYSPAHFRQRFLGHGARSGATHSFVVPTSDGDGGGAVVGFVSFALVPLRTPQGRVVQAQLLECVAGGGGRGADDVSGALLRDLLAAALREARSCGAHVFNALALGELTPALLESLGFARGDADTFVNVEEVESSAALEVERERSGYRRGYRPAARGIAPREVSWLPTG
eukprot:5552286-Prymnesium_polylepis.1